MCSVDGCSNPVKARGYCNRHWLRWRRYGDPLESRRWRPWQEQVRERIGEPDVNGCWPWIGHVNQDGYGVLHRRDWGRPKKAHRLVYELMVGPIPDGLDLDHLCRVRHCVNPAHLEPCTRGQNVLRGDGTSARHARKRYCVRGHDLDDPDVARTWINPKTSKSRRMCRICERERRKGRRP